MTTDMHCYNHFFVKRIDKLSHLLMVQKCSLAHSVSATRMVRNCFLARYTINKLTDND